MEPYRKTQTIRAIETMTNKTKYGSDEQLAMNKCAALGFNPIEHPLGSSHHTEVPATDEDKRVGDAIAYFLGTLCGGLYEPNDFENMSSVDQWTVVARALRVHGLKIRDAEQAV